MSKKATIIVFLVLLFSVGLLLGLRYLREVGREELSNDETLQTQERYLLRIKKDCPLDLPRDSLFELETRRFVSFGIELTKRQKKELEQNSCVLKIRTAQEVREKFKSLPPEIQEKILERIKKHKLSRTIVSRDLIDRKRLLKLLKEKEPVLPPETISHYQLYITPESPAVLELAKKTKSYQEAYQKAVNWVWVAEKVLNQVEEKWLTPQEFLSQTPTYSTNPLPGRIVSDCSEQANALASLLRAQGMPAEKVRVVLGEVNFEGKIGGHAWVQIQERGRWIDLDPTSGPYWDEQAKRLVPSKGLPMNYFEFFPFPVVQTWAYYNDQYFYDLETRQGNAPLSWR